MAKYLLWVLLFIFFLPSFSFSQYVGTGSNTSTTYVNGYYRSDGTYVRGHYRTSRNSYNLDNFSAQGNFNPYTGEFGDIEYSTPYNSLNENGNIYFNYDGSNYFENYDKPSTTTKFWFETEKTDKVLKESSSFNKDLNDKEKLVDKEHFKIYLLSLETIMSEIFALDLSKVEDRKKYIEIFFNEDKYILHERFEDINNDGYKDLLIENLSPSYTGTGGYATYIFINKYGRYQFLQSFFGDYVEVQNSSTKNFKDITFEHKKYLEEGGFKYVKDLLTWDGNEYTQ